MNRINLKRFIAYVIDFFIVALLTQAIVNISYLNPIYEEYNKSTEDYTYFTFSYYKMTSLLDSYYQDKIINEEEYENLISNNDVFGYLVIEAYDDKVISEEEYNSMKDVVSTNYDSNYNDLYYNANKNLWFYDMVYIILVILYFGWFNYITKGVTLGKKLMRLRIVSEDNKEISLVKFILRSIILYSVCFYLIDIVVCFMAAKENMVQIYNVVNFLEEFVIIAIMFSILFSKENKGFHDMLLKTKVVEDK